MVLGYNANLSPSWKLLQSREGGRLLGGAVNVILPSFQVFDFELTPEDMETINGINRNMRYYEFLP